MSNTEKLYDNLNRLYEKIDDKTELKKLIKVMNSEDIRKIYEIYLSDSEKIIVMYILHHTTTNY